MTTKQQNETLQYFKDYAEDWHRKAVSTDEKKVNVIQQRNGYVLKVIRARAITRSALDVGCGTGDLARDIARQGIAAEGVDFAAEMIDLAREKARRDILPQAQFHCCSIFDYDMPDKGYDVISANGFIEYISLEELDRFLTLTCQALNSGGSLVLGSRNRLFNLFSLNAYTLNEIEQGTVTSLLQEAIALVSGADFSQLVEMKPAPLPVSDSTHAKTGNIEVSTRYQFTPVQLMQMLNEKGLVTKQIYPIHIHGVPPAFKGQHPEVHTGISNLLQNYGQEDLSIIPHSSSFMVHAVRA